MNGRLWFGANNGATGNEPFVSDGTLAGTSLLVDIQPALSSSTPRYWTACGPNQVVFTTSTATGFGSEPWVTDGTPAGTFLLRDIYPGASGSQPESLFAVGNLTYFVATDPATGR